MPVRFSRRTHLEEDAGPVGFGRARLFKDEQVGLEFPRFDQIMSIGAEGDGDAALDASPEEEGVGAIDMEIDLDRHLVSFQQVGDDGLECGGARETRPGEEAEGVGQNIHPAG